MEDEIGAAEQAVAKLSSRLGEILARRAAINRERPALALASHAEGDRAAAKTLASLMAEGHTIDAEAATLDIALVEAKKRLAALQQAAAEESRRRQARATSDAALLLVEDFRTAGASLATAVEGLKSALIELSRVNLALQRVGASALGGEPMRVNLDRAIQSALQETTFGRYVPPSQRVTIDELIEGWAGMATTRARAIAGDIGSRAPDEAPPASELEALERALGGDDDPAGRLVA